MKALLSYAGALMILSAGVLHSAPTDRYEELTGEADDLRYSGEEWQESETKIPDLPPESGWA